MSSTSATTEPLTPAAGYADLVARLAAGEEVDVVAVDAAVQAAGKTMADLARDVDRAAHAELEPEALR